MANEVENIVSNMSYTNKDFIAVYTELLDLFRKLTYKYDPSISNASDPGVILTKINALIADKNNYNIDKNILETFPVSVTQESNARDLFAQLGYRMKWYRSATTPITVAYSGDTQKNASIPLPRFTMISNSENEIVYTTTEEASIPMDKTKTVEVPSMQGIAVDYELNGSNIIKFSSLDANRRLYFTDPMIAENGIFICNADNKGERGNNYSDWVMVDNMYVYPTNTNYKYYEFGITHDGTPFIQFSEVADRQFKDGIFITYLKTLGLEGNVRSKFLTHFFNTVNVTVGSEEMSLTEDNTKIINALNAVDGHDKETIDEAYNNYKKTKGVFDTLVSLRDYMDYINSLDVISNSFVCDRTDDVQDSYKALMNNDGQISYYTYVDTDGSSPLMSAFDLKLYCLNYVGTPTNGTQYNDTFLMLNPSSALLSKVKDLIQDVKSIQHDYKDIETDKICYLINSFPLGIRVIPHSKVTALQARDIVANVVTALFKNFNAREVNFGEAASYDKIYSTILSADPLIKTVVLDDIVYDTHACYFEKVGNDYILRTDLVVSGDTPSVQHIGTVNDAGTTFTKTDSNTLNNGDLCYATNTHKVYISTSGTTVSEHTLGNFKFEIYAKAVLNGNSPLLVKDDKFNYSLTQSMVGEYENVSTITTNTNLNFSADADPDDGNFLSLKQSEGVIFYIPSYEVTEEYSTYVAIETNRVLSNEGGTTVYGLPRDRVTLSGSEKVILYWKESDDDSNYHYRSFAAGSTIEMSGEVRCYYNGDSLIGGALPVGEGIVTNYDTNVSIKENLYKNNSVLSGSKSLKVLKQIKVSLSPNSQKCYWVLNKKTSKQDNGNIVLKYVLFSLGQTDYILQNGEYFFYTDPSMTSLNILYPGTRISRSLASGYDTLPEWSCTVAENDEFDNITTDGASAISSDIWQMIPSSFSLSCEEMQMYSVSGSGSKVRVMDGSSSASITLDKDVAPLSAGLTITLVSQDGSTEELPQAVGVGASLYGNSFLSYISSPTSPMVLNDSRQSVKFYGADGTQIGSTVTGNSSSPYNILSDDEYSLVGGSNIDVTRAVVSATSISYEKMKAYVYQSATMTNISNPTADRIPLVFDSSHTSCSITFKVPAGDYVVPLDNPTNGVFDAAEVSAETGGSVSVADIFGQTGFGLCGIYYLKLHSDGTNSITLTVSYDYESVELSSSYTLTLGKLYKYTENGNFDNPVTLQAMIDKVTSLDSQHKFDYIYEIPVDSYIENPLDGESFTNENHPYNKFTICEIDVSSLNNIKVNNMRS